MLLWMMNVRFERLTQKKKTKLYKICESYYLIQVVNGVQM